MEGKRDYAKEIHESIRLYRANRDLEAENRDLEAEIEKLRNEKKGLEYILREQNDTIEDRNQTIEKNELNEREKCNKIVDILNRLNKKLDEIPFKKID